MSLLTWIHNLLDLEFWEFISAQIQVNIESLTIKLLRFDNQQLIEVLTASFSTKEDEIEVTNFFKEHSLANSQIKIQQVIDKIGRRREVIEKNGPIIKKST